MNTTHARFFISMSPQYFKIDYNSSGEWELGTGWSTFDDNNYPIKILEHKQVSDLNIYDDELVNQNFGT
jgi:hypothetical protein